MSRAAATAAGRSSAVVVLLALAVALGCHPRRASSPLPAAAARDCAPVAEALAPTADVGQLPGTYRITFVAARGPAEGGSPVQARLELRAQDSALVRLDIASAEPGSEVTQPVIGRLDLAPERVGAVNTGDPMSADPMRPGVAAYVTRRPDGGVTSLTLRVGSQSNVRGVLLFDGGYFALYTRRVGPDGFAGGWASGGVGMERAEGHFCATKLFR